MRIAAGVQGADIRCSAMLNGNTSASDSGCDALLVSFHRRSGTGGGEFVSRSFANIVRRALEGNVVEVYHDDRAGVRRFGGLALSVSRRGRLVALLRLLFTAELGRLRLEFTGDPHVHVRGRFLFVDGVGLADMAGKARRHFERAVVLHHNFEPDYHADSHAGELLGGFYLRAARHAVSRAFRDAALNLFLSREDMDKTRTLFGEPSGNAAVLGVFEPIVPLKHHRASEESVIRILISGNLSVRKGYLGTTEMLRAATECRPKLGSRVNFLVAGRDPTTEMKALADGAFIQVIANPVSIDHVAQSCDIYLNPNYTGSGVKVRNLDGLRNGLPVFCRAENAAGFSELGAPSFQTFSSAADGLAQIEKLDPAVVKSDRMRHDVWRAYAERFDLRVGVARLKRLLTSPSLSRG